MADPIKDEKADAREFAKAIEDLRKASEKLGNLPDVMVKLASDAGKSSETNTGPSKPVAPSAKERQDARKSSLNRAEMDGTLGRPTGPPRPPKPIVYEEPPPIKPPKEIKPPKPPKEKKPPKEEEPEPSRARKVWGALRNDPGLGQAVTGNRAGRAVSGAADAYKGGTDVAKAAGLEGAGAAGMAGKALPVIGAIVAVGGALNDFRKHIQEAAESALEAHRKYAELSGQQAAIFAESDMKQMQRDIRHGDATAGTTKELANSEDRRKDMMAPLNTAIENLQNTVVASANEMMTNLAEPFVAVATEMFKDLRKIKEYLFGKVDTKVEEFGTLNDIKDKINADAAAATNRALAKMAKARASAKRVGFERPGEGR